jgi:dTDP-4-dehydrorhamnose reductase
MNKILVIGATGMVASRFIELSKDNFTITQVDEKILDITDKIAVENYFSEHNFDSVINFAAYTNVDAAEKERGQIDGLVWKLNVIGPQNLIQVCKQKNIFYVQISTDFAFTGSQEIPGPYAEDQETPNELSREISWYGWTKNRAERIVLDSGAPSSVVRIAYPFFAADFNGKLDFAKTYLKLFDEGNLYPLFTDQTMSFLNVDDLAEPLSVILRGCREGIFHIVSSNTGTPFEFVEYLLKKARGVESVVQNGSIKKFLEDPLKTPRPVFGGLKTEITQKKLGVKFKTWQRMVDDFVEKLN